MDKYFKITYNILRSFSLPIFSFIISIIGIKFFGKQNWGQFIYVLTLVNFFAFLGNFGNKDLLLRKYSDNPSKIINYFATSFSSRIILLLFSILLFITLPIKIAFSSFILIFLIFTYQSFESLIIYHQQFLHQLITEIIGFIIIISCFVYNFNFELSTILYTYISSYLFKIIYLLILFKKEFTFLKFKFSLIELKTSFPFFLIIFSGWTASKIDLYIVNFKLSNSEIAEYQLGITAFLLLQSLSYLIIVPFNKHIYRLPKKTIKKLKLNLSYISFPVVILGTMSIWFILEQVAKVNLPIKFYILGAIASIPTFFFIIDVLMFYRKKREKIILKINLISAIINFAITYYLIDFYGILGAITSVLITQYIILSFYKFNFLK